MTRTRTQHAMRRVVDSKGHRDAAEELQFASAGGLRSRLVALAALRGAAEGWAPCERTYLATLLAPYTDAVLHELAKREQGAAYVPYPHPIGRGPFDQTSETTTTEGGR